MLRGAAVIRFAALRSFASAQDDSVGRLVILNEVKNLDVTQGSLSRLTDPRSAAVVKPAALRSFASAHDDSVGAFVILNEVKNLDATQSSLSRLRHRRPNHSLLTTDHR